LHTQYTSNSHTTTAVT